MEGIFTAWGRILARLSPALSIEITRECPLRCPGCYAYGDDHLGGDVTLREVRDFKGQELIDGVLGARRSASPAARLDRRRRAARALPRAERRCCRMLVEARHPRAARHQRGARDSRRVARRCRGCQIVVSIDGLQPEHDVRRTPATYDRILKHIAGHTITVHCTVTRQQVQPRRLHRRVPAVLVGATRSRARSGSACTRRRSARCRTSGCGRPIASAWSPT